MSDLERQAREAWELAFTFRHHRNWGRALLARSELAKRFLRAPHPKIRRVAAMTALPEDGRAA